MRRISLQAGVGFKEFLGVAILLVEGYGRVAMSKKLGYRERLVRDVLDAIKCSEPARRSLEVIGSLHRLVFKPGLPTCTPVVYSNLGEELLDAVLKNVVSLRDYIVAYSGSPAKVEVVGVIKGGKLQYPGLPDDISGPYLGVFEDKRVPDGIVVCWRNYVEYVDDSTLLASLANLCPSTL